MLSDPQPEIKRGWKVLRVVDERVFLTTLIADPGIITQRFVSAISLYSQFNYEITYTPDVWVKPHPNCGPMAVFATKSDAVNFVVKEIHLLVIRECEYKPSKETQIWYYLKGIVEPNMRVFVDLKYLPDGSVLADEVKIL